MGGALLLLAFLAIPTLADEVDDGLRRARALVRTGQDSQAISVYEEVLKKIEAGESSPETHGAVLNELGKLYHEEGQLERAEELYSRALPLLEQSFGKDHLHVAAVVYNLGRLRHDQHRLDEADQLYQRALLVWLETYGPHHPLSLSALEDLGRLNVERGSYGDAETILKRLVEIREDVHGTGSPEIVPALSDLAGLYVLLGRDAEAEVLYARALALLQRRDGADVDRAAVLGHLALLNARHERPAVAERLLRQAIEIYVEKAPESADHAAALNNLAQIYADTGRNEEAEDTFLQALTVAENAYGEASVELVPSLVNLASLYDRQGRHGDAYVVTRRTVELLGPARIQAARQAGEDASAEERAWREAAALHDRQVRTLSGQEPAGTETTSTTAESTTTSDSTTTTIPPMPTTVLPTSSLVPTTSIAPPTSIPPTTSTVQTTFVPTTTTVASPDAVYRVQIGARRDSEDAHRFLQQALAKHADLLSGVGSRVQEVDLSEKGVWFRAQLGPLLKEEARELCAELKRRGGDCIVVRAP